MMIACSAEVSMAAWAESGRQANAMRDTAKRRKRRIKGTPESLLVDDDLRVGAAEACEPRQRRIGRADIIERAYANPIKPLAFSVDWRNEKPARGIEPLLQPVGILKRSEGAGLHIQMCKRRHRYLCHLPR